MQYPPKTSTLSGSNFSNIWGKERDLEGRLVNFLMRDGKKSKARKIVTKAGAYLRNQGFTLSNDLLLRAVSNASPLVILRTKRVAAQSLRVPFPLTPSQRESLGLRWIVGEARREKGVGMGERLGRVLLETSQNRGKLVQKRNLLLQEVQRNRGNLFHRWS